MGCDYQVFIAVLEDLNALVGCNGCLLGERGVYLSMRSGSREPGFAPWSRLLFLPSFVGRDQVTDGCCCLYAEAQQVLIA